MKCKHCGKTINDKEIARYLAGKGGKAVSGKVKSDAGRLGAIKKWENRRKALQNQESPKTEPI